jgi:hypothetical protein
LPWTSFWRLQVWTEPAFNPKFNLKLSRKGWLSLVVVLAVLALAVGLVLALWTPEPSFEGRSMTSWLEQYSTNHFVRRGSAADKEAEHAIREIGTNGIPFLLNLLRSDSVIAKKIAVKLPRRFSSRIYSDDHLRLGSHGFVALGTNGQSAVRELIELSKSGDRDVRYRATYSLGHLASAGEPAIPRLIELVDDENSSARGQALMSLSMIHLNAQLVVPVLLKCAVAPERNIVERTSAIRGLRYYGEAADEILPVLLKLQEDEDINVRNEATNSIRAIKPRDSTIPGK